MNTKPAAPTVEQLREELAKPDEHTIRRVWNWLESEGYVIGLGSDARCQALQDADDQLRRIVENANGK